MIYLGWFLVDGIESSNTMEFTDGPIYIVGEHFNLFDQESSSVDDPFHKRQCTDYISSSFLFCSYRRDFPVINAFDCNSDIGWGCMVRTGQMLAAKAIISVCFGREYDFQNFDNSDPRYLEILSWFYDFPDAIFSIHKIVDQNHLLNGLDTKDIIRGGEWFSPSKISRSLKQMFNAGKPYGIMMYAPRNDVIYIDEVIELCTATSDVEFHNSWSPLLILITTRMGLKTLNPLYIPHLKSLLESQYSIGFIGGKPKSSLYFIGYQDDDIIYLDPHFVQPTIRSHPPSEEELATYRPQSPMKMPFTEIDPCLAAGFILHTKEEFFDFIEWHQALSEDPDQYTIFTFEPNRTIYEDIDSM
eukprot:TRINITY_DN5972_c0_g1_i1.p1 TRINITY_DN5972_c0_g1~~TRINITY_DN5972_c0_g1_i1.p1  ORF type:complete len:357 (+),score=63.31 TRINITY_DN5972_c0_g1_i1:495-1565(+)